MKNEDKVIILPIKEPWATMIKDSKKRFEFRSWNTDNWRIGQEIWIVATGKAKSPREVITKVIYMGSQIVEADESVKKTKTCYAVGVHTFKWTIEDLEAIGGKVGDNAIWISNPEQIIPFTLESIGIMRTPQKYQYYEKGSNGK